MVEVVDLQPGWHSVGKRSNKLKALQEPYTFIAHESHIIDLIFTPDGEQLLTAGMDNIVNCYAVKDWSLLRRFVGHEKSVNSLNVTRDGKRLITASSDKTVRLWDMNNGEEVVQFNMKGAFAQLSR